MIPCRPMPQRPLSLAGDPSRVPPDRLPGPVDVIVPVYGAPEAFARCLASLLAHTDLSRNRLVLVLDGPQPPETGARLARATADHPEGVLLLRNPERQGFVGAVNLGMAASDRDVILLNSDTAVTIPRSPRTMRPSSRQEGCRRPCASPAGSPRRKVAESRSSLESRFAMQLIDLSAHLFAAK